MRRAAQWVSHYLIQLQTVLPTVTIVLRASCLLVTFCGIFAMHFFGVCHTRQEALTPLLDTPHMT